MILYSQPIQHSTARPPRRVIQGTSTRTQAAKKNFNERLCASLGISVRGPGNALLSSARHQSAGRPSVRPPPTLRPTSSSIAFVHPANRLCSSGQLPSSTPPTVPLRRRRRRRPPQTIICATPCPPSILLPVNAWPFSPASPYSAAVMVSRTAAAMRLVAWTMMLSHCTTAMTR